MSDTRSQLLDYTPEVTPRLRYRETVAAFDVHTFKLPRTLRERYGVKRDAQIGFATFSDMIAFHWWWRDGGEFVLMADQGESLSAMRQDFEKDPAKSLVVAIHIAWLDKVRGYH